MSVRWGTAVSVAVVALVAGCSGGAGSGGSGTPTARPATAGAPATTGAPGAAAAPKARWTAAANAVESPRPVAGGFAFSTITAGKTFSVVSVAAGTGRVRWRAPASPSLIAPGVAQQTTVVDGGKTVVWLAPGNSTDAGATSITAADAVTGQIRWTYGGGGFFTLSPLTACHGGGEICAVGALGSAGIHYLTLDARTGQVRNTRDLGGTTTARQIGMDQPTSEADSGTIGLLDLDGSLSAVDFDAGVLWTRPTTAVFGGLPVTPNQGWDIREAGGRFVGSLGYQAPGTPAATTREAREPGATAAFDIRTGRTLWTRQDAQMDCGGVTFDTDHPALCSGSYTLGSRGTSDPKVLAADITLFGIDPATGRTTWSWRAGNVPGLVLGSADVVQVDETHYTLRRGGTTTTLDLDRGPSTVRQPVGWCQLSRNVPTAYTAFEQYDPSRSYRAEAIRPCAASGRAVAGPATTPSFAGGSAGGVFAWTDERGTVHAVTAR